MHYRTGQCRRRQCADHAVFGCRYIGIGYAPNGMAGGEADFETLCGIIGAAAKPFSDGGYRLMYHNHALEFARSADGRTWFDRLLERYGNAPLGFTLDTYWLQAAGLDAADFIRTLSGRVPCIHLKDMGVRGNASVMAPVGSGNMDFDKIIKAGADAGAEYLLVEQDDCGGEDPFVCLKKSYQFLTSRGL